MKQRVVALLSLAGGLFGFGLAGLIQLDRTALTTPRSGAPDTAAALVMPARTETPVAADTPDRTEALPETQVLSLEPILITGRRARPWGPAPVKSPLFQPPGAAAPAAAPAAAAPAVPDT